ncbi:MAG: ABC transporter substrate-binding protein [Chloroflexi bacterium]|nr:ABC transporter substrate-binding protein [Chloroflexota bacterium]
MRPTRMLWVLGILLAGTMLFLAACGDDDGDDDGPTAEPDATEPADGAEVPGISDTEIVLGAHTSLTGPIAAYSIIPTMAAAYFEYINETEGGVNGRLITYLLEDDQYSPPLAVDLTRKLVEQDGIFALFNALGTPNHLQVIDYLQDQGVPDMYLATGATEWVRDPAARPFTFGSNPNYTGEGLVIGKYISDNFPGGKYGVILQNDDFGIDGLAGVKLGVNDTVELVGEEPYEVTDPDLNSQVDRLRAAEADVVVIFSTPLLLGNAIRHARQDLNWDVPFIISAVSMNELTGLIAGADVIEGTIGPVATFMHWQEDHPGIQRHLEILEFAGIDRSGASVLTLYAQYVAEMMVETLRRAGDNPTRESLVEAAESLEDWTCSICLYSVTLGPDDHDPGQTLALGEYRGGRIEITGPAYSYEGVAVADLSVDTLVEVELPEGAQP